MPRELDRDLGHHRQHALRAGDQRQQVVTRRIQPQAAEFDDVTVDGHPPHLEQVVDGQPVLEAMHAARVFGHIAADGAGDLGRGIGRVVQPMGRRRLGDGQVAHPGLHHRPPRMGVDGDDPAQAREGQHHPEAVRLGAAGEAGPRPPGHHRHPLPGTDLQDGHHLSFSLRQHHDQRHLAQGRHAVALVGAQVFRVMEHAGRRQHAQQRLHQAVGINAGEIHLDPAETGNPRLLAHHATPLSIC